MINDIPQRQGIMFTLLSLHVDLFAGLPGTLFIGAMGLCFLASMVSGIVLYGPFTKRLDFGAVRTKRSPRVRWLDLHNLLGIVATAWLLVVGVTGVINTLALPLLSVWQRTELADMTAAWRGKPGLATLTSAQQAIETARLAAPGMDVAFMRFPGSRFATSHHYLIFMRGESALTKRLFKPVMVDAENGTLTDSRCTALVPHDAAAVAAAALRRLRRHAAQDHLGAARPRDHRRAGQRRLSLAGAPQVDGRSAVRRDRGAGA